MKKIKCDELGFKECNWEFLAETDEEVIRKAGEHDRVMHDVELDEVELRGHIHTV